MDILIQVLLFIFVTTIIAGIVYAIQASIETHKAIKEIKREDLYDVLLKDLKNAKYLFHYAKSRPATMVSGDEEIKLKELPVLTNFVFGYGNAPLPDNPEKIKGLGTIMNERMKCRYVITCDMSTQEAFVSHTETSTCILGTYNHKKSHELYMKLLNKFECGNEEIKFVNI